MALNRMLLMSLSERLAELIIFCFRTACCPVPCRGAFSHFNINGKCYDNVEIGQACDYPAQCNGQSSCIPNVFPSG